MKHNEAFNICIWIGYFKPLLYFVVIDKLCSRKHLQLKKARARAFLGVCPHCSLSQLTVVRFQLSCRACHCRNSSLNKFQLWWGGGISATTMTWRVWPEDKGREEVHINHDNYCWSRVVQSSGLHWLRSTEHWDPVFPYQFTSEDWEWQFPTWSCCVWVIPTWPGTS